MSVVGNTLDVVTENLAHLGRKNERIGCFHKVADAALARLGVDTDNVRFVLSADVLGVDGEIGHIPDVLRRNVFILVDK